MTGVLAVRDLEVAYAGAGLGVQGISLDVGEGRIVAMLGANGAGKTTTLRAIGGFLPSDYATVTRGTMTFAGRTLGKLPPHRRAGLGLAIVPERDKVFRQLSVEQNLRVSTGRRGDERERELTELVYELFPALTSRRTTAAGFLSGGERQMLGIGRALMADPLLLLADEVSLGIAPNLVVTMLDALRRINAMRGTSILLVEQNAPAALRVADYVYVLSNGRVTSQGTPAELRAASDMSTLYLGAGEAAGDAGRTYARRARAVPWG